MARYRKIDTRIWNDEKFNGLSDDGKLVFFLLLTHPHLTSVGAMRASLPGLAGELHWSMERLKQAFAEGLLKQMIRYNEAASFIWLPQFLKYNQPESPNVVRSWEQALDYLPECTLKNELTSQLKCFVESLSPAFREALPKAFGKNMLNQEQEQEQEQKQEQKQKKKKTFMSGKPDVFPETIFLEEEKKSALRKQAVEILEFLNEKTGRIYRPVDTNLKLIMARLESGATLGNCFQVIAKKTREWKDDSRMALYLRPATLFNATKFEQYVGELVVPQQSEDNT